MNHREVRIIEAPRRGWRLSALSLVIALVCLAGVAVAVYPSTAQWLSAVQEAEKVQLYGTDVEALGPASRVEALEQAEAYNSALRSGAQLQADTSVPVGNATELPRRFDYPSLLAANRYGLMGRIQIPSIDADLPIYHGTSDATLAMGVGHLEGTSLPVGGIGTNAVLTGHRGLASAELFTRLDSVALGDIFTIDVFGRTLSYAVRDIRVVDPDQTEALDPVPGEDLVTLVTCTPIGVNSQRILVIGERLLPTPADAIADAKAPPSGPGFPWWAGIYLSVTVAAAVYVWWSGKPLAPREDMRRPIPMSA